MIYKILRFVGAIIAAVIFSYLNETVHLAFFAGAAHFFANLTWTNWFSFDTLRGFLLPLIWTFLSLIGMGLVWMVRGSKVISAIPIIWFVLSIVAVFRILFLEPVELITNDIGEGFWYYTGATVTFAAISICYVICAISMLVSNEN